VLFIGLVCNSFSTSLWALFLRDVSILCTLMPTKCLPSADSARLQLICNGEEGVGSCSTHSRWGLRKG
jgi:hypothetical protein